MRAPVSWIREYADLPADLSGRGARPAADRARPEARVARATRGRRSAVRSWSAACSRWSPSRRRTARPSTGAPSTSVRRTGRGSPRGSSAARTTSRPATSWSSCCPAGCCPADFEISARKTYGHVSAGMICSARELGIGDDHDGIIVLAGRRGSARRRRASGARARRGGHRVRDQPRPGLRAVRCAVWHARRRWPSTRRTPTRALRDGAGRERRRLPGPGRGSRRLSRCSWRAPSPASTRPRRSPDWLATPRAARRDAADLAGRRRHQLRDARDRPADPRLRRRQAPGPARRTTGAARASG